MDVVPSPRSFFETNTHWNTGETGDIYTLSKQVYNNQIFK